MLSIVGEAFRLPFFYCAASDAICGFSVGTDVLGGPLKQFGISFVMRRDTRPRPTGMWRRFTFAPAPIKNPDKILQKIPPRSCNSQKGML